METLEHPLPFGDRYPRSVVDYREPDLLGTGSVDLEANEPLIAGGVLDRVTSEVAQRLSEPVGVSAQRSSGHSTELEAAFSTDADPIPKLSDESVKVDRLRSEKAGLLG
jgi:hypothetical protein